MDKVEGGEIDPQEIFSKMFGGGESSRPIFLTRPVASCRLVEISISLKAPEAFYDYIGEISLVKDFTSTMDVVMTPEERAAMEAAEEEANGPKGAAEGTGTATAPAASTTAPVAGDNTAAATSSGTAASTAASTAESNTALAHHSSFSSSEKTSGQATPTATASGSSSHLAKKDDGASAAATKKGKAKLSPEQKAKLDELERKQDEDKKRR